MFYVVVTDNWVKDPGKVQFGPFSTREAARVAMDAELEQARAAIIDGDVSAEIVEVQ